VDSFVVSTEVTCLPLSEVLARHSIDRADLLLIDTEGYDWEVLRQVDLATLDPQVILFEHKHLSAQDRSRACAFLESRYRCHDLGADYFCARR
jgi:hypothetical protein